MKKPELLLPAKGPEELKTAVTFGADAVYIGGQFMSLRASARNFSPEEMKDSISFAHSRGAKVYVTANIFAHNGDLEAAGRYFSEIREIRPDALLISDPGIFDLAREVCPEIDIHISTQANTTNYRTALFWRRLGARRLVVARELSLQEISELRQHLPEDMEIEAFVHGAMCISYSGRCLLSNYFTGRDANKGACSHPCRWRYSLVEETRPGVYLPVEENERGTYVFNSKDLCMVSHIPELVRAGVNSLKIEGRMKNALYVAVTARTYRKAIDDFFESEQVYRDNIPRYEEEIRKCTTRQFYTGFYFGKPDVDSQIYDNNTYTQDYVYLGIVEDVTEDGGAVIRQKNKFSVGDQIEVMKPGGENVPMRVEEIRDPEMGNMPSAPHPGQRLFLRLSELKGSEPLFRQDSGFDRQGKSSGLIDIGDVLRIRKQD
ncbi:MAG: U32 family peptidase [Lachnospiraceae bacterium]|nr:U32 family peptidase [Lachnospiraceae bacterium]